MFTALDLQKSLKGLPYLGDYSGFPLNTNQWSQYIAHEQILKLNVLGLKPGTTHKVFLNDIDVTSLCKQQGKSLGAGLRTPSSTDPVSLGLQFVYYFRAGPAATTPVEQAAAYSILLGGVRTLDIRSDDGTSTASVQLGIPLYARGEVETIIKKTPSPDPDVIGQVVSYVETSKAVTNPNSFYTPSNFSLIQTFYADPEIVQGASEVNITSIDLFFKLKPSLTSNLSGNPNAGVAVAICEVDSEEPNLQKTYADSLSYVEAARIFSFGDASTATTFSLPQPLKLATGRFYGIVVIFEDPGYLLWTNKTGDRLVNTNIPSPGINSNKDGKLFYRNSSNVFNSMSDTDIKFNIKCAKYVSQSDKKIFVNKDYEFFTVTNQTGNFLSGESVWQNTSPDVGTISFVQGSNTITGSNTFFAAINANNKIVIQSGSQSQVVVVTNIISNTSLNISGVMEFSNTVGQLYSNTVVGNVYIQDKVNNKVYLKDSNADSIRFAPGQTFVGVDSGATANIVSVDNISIDRVRLKASLRTPASGTVDTTLKFTQKNANNAYTYDENIQEKIKINNQQAYNLTRYNAFILSRSNEVQEAALYSNTENTADRKSLKAEVDFAVLGTGTYMSPFIEGSKLDLYTIENRASNTCDITTGGVVIDTEVLGNGRAISKHIGSKVQFSNDKFAEDVRMFMVAYRPAGTEIRCYARLYNSKDPEAFDDKAWTPLEYVENANKFSSTDNENDFIEYELGLPQFSESANTLPGTFTTALNSNAITVANSSFSNVTSFIANNDVIKIYNPLFPLNNYQIAVVKEANNTQITIGGVIETTNVAGPGLNIDKVKYPNIAFNNVNNTNISRYYNSTLAEFDTFDTMQIKVVMLSDTTYTVPKLDQIQVLGVSA